MGDREYVIGTYGEKRKDIKKKMDLEEKKNELNRQVELSCGFEELRRGLDDFEEAKKWKAIGEIDRQEEVGDQLQTIQEENENDSRTVFSEKRKMAGVRVQTRRNRDQMAKIWGMWS